MRTYKRSPTYTSFCVLFIYGVCVCERERERERERVREREREQGGVNDGSNKIILKK